VGLLFSAAKTAKLEAFSNDGGVWTSSILAREPVGRTCVCVLPEEDKPRYMIPRQWETVRRVLTYGIDLSGEAQ
jgi:hypothetical protein